MWLFLLLLIIYIIINLNNPEYFLGCTQVYIDDHNTKNIKDLKLGDVTKSGKVTSIQKSLDNTFKFKGIHTTPKNIILNKNHWTKIDYVGTPSSTMSINYNITTNKNVIYVKGYNGKPYAFANYNGNSEDFNKMNIKSLNCKYFKDCDEYCL